MLPLIFRAQQFYYSVLKTHSILKKYYCFTSMKTMKNHFADSYYHGTKDYFTLTVVSRCTIKFNLMPVVKKQCTDLLCTESINVSQTALIKN